MSDEPVPDGAGSEGRDGHPPMDRSYRADLGTLAGGAGVVLTGRLLGRGLQLINQVVLARYLGPASFGLFAIGWALLRVVRVAGPLGVHNGVIHFGTRHWLTAWGRLKDVLVVSLRTAVGSGVVVGVVFFAAAPWLAEHVFRAPEMTWVVRGFAVSFPFVTVLRVAAAATRLTEKMQYSVLAEDVIQSGAQLLGAIILLWMGWRLFAAVGSAVASFVVAALVSLILGLVVFRSRLRGPRVPTMGTPELLRFSVPTALSGVLSGSVLWVDRLFLGALADPASVGVYQAASQVAMVMIIILSGFGAIFTPMISRLHHAEERQRLSDLFRTSTKWGLYLSLPILAVVLADPRGVIGAVYGAEYVEGTLPLAILTLGQLVNLGTGSSAYLLIMTGHQDTWLKISGSAFLLNLLLNWILIPVLGATGAAVATAIAVAVLFTTALFQVRRRLRLWPYDRRYLKGAAAFATALAAMVLWPEWVRVAGGVEVILQLVVAAIVAGTVLAALRLDEEDRELARLVHGRARQLLG